MITIKFNIAAAAIAGAVGFAIALRVAGIINMPSKGYRSIFLDLMPSAYTGYKASKWHSRRFADLALLCACRRHDYSGWACIAL